MQKTINLKDIKCIVWDLDDTFWKGTLSEGSIEFIPEHIAFVKKLNDVGIVCSICSKNDESAVITAMNRQDKLLEEFVFASVNWQPKGERLKRLISDMGLRECNVLFLDDNNINIEEARFYCPDLMTATPDEIPNLINQLEDFPCGDSGRKRLKQYKVLEKKLADKNLSSSNDEFLKASKIKVQIDKNCVTEFERAYEIIQRTNQLNFTKLRSTREELSELFSAPDCETGIVRVRDKYGDYGVVGFYALKCGGSLNTLIHFAFSCRTIGMGIEQYVYAMLGYPELVVVPEVASQVVKGYCPDYINADSDEADDCRAGVNTKVLFKGPCDLDQLFSFINADKNVKTEFTYVSPKIGSVVQYNHTINILASLEQNSQEMFTEPELYRTELFTGKYNSVFISLLPDTGLGVYKNKTTGKKIVFGDYMFSLTDRDNWQNFIDGTYYTAGLKMTEELLNSFAEAYEYEGLISEADFFENLCKIRENLNKATRLYFVNGTEMHFFGNTNPAYENRHIVHQKYNSIARRVCEKYPNTYIFDVNNYVKEQTDFTNSPNHYKRNIYYAMAQDLTALINENVGKRVGSLKNLKVYKIKKFIIRILSKIKHAIFR